MVLEPGSLLYRILVKSFSFQLAILTRHLITLLSLAVLQETCSARAYNSRDLVSSKGWFRRARRFHPSSLLPFLNPTLPVPSPCCSLLTQTRPPPRSQPHGAQRHL